MSPLASKIRDLKYSFLQAQRTSGECSQQFVEDYIAAWYKTPEAQRFLAVHTEEMLKAVARSQWRIKLSNVSDRQMALHINGAPSPVELRYRDMRPEGERLAGGFVTVLVEYATIEQFSLAWQVLQENANKQIAAADAMYKQMQTLLKRANGNTSASVVDFLDP